MAKTIAAAWNVATASDKVLFEELAKMEKLRYKKAVIE
jgi:hypothetical protein